MDAPSNNLRTVRPAEIDPRFNRGRHLPALGTMAAIAIETYCPATDRYSAACMEAEVVVTDRGCQVISLFPAEESDSDYFEQVQRKPISGLLRKIERMMAAPRALHYWARLATYPERP